MRSSTSTSPISSSLSSRAAGVAVLADELFAIFADDLVDAGLVDEDAEILVDLVEQLGMFLDELFLFEIHQLAERHLQDGVGLHRRERVFLGDAALLLELGEANVAERPLQHGAAGVLIAISRSLASACVFDARITRITSSMLAWASSRPCTVCFRLRARASRNCVRRRITVTRCRTNSCSISLSESVRGLPSTSASRMIENESCSGENL